MTDDIRAYHFARLGACRLSREYQEWYASVGGPEVEPHATSLVGERWEITADIYDEFLNMMPPLHWRGGSFYLCEEIFDGYYAKFSQVGDRYYCDFARLPRRDRSPGMEP